MVCHNCGKELDFQATICVNCGAVTHALDDDEVLWTGSTAGDTVVGWLIGSALFILLGIGLIADPILYFCLRRRRKSLALGFLLAIILPLLLILGIFVVCFAQPMFVDRIIK